MKYALFLLVCTLSVSLLSAQENVKPEPPYRQFPTVPPFKFLLTDSTTVYTKEDLPARKSVLLMLFSPECDHCRHQIDSILARVDEFKNVQIVLATVLPFDRLRNFYTEYQLQKYPNIVAGRDFQFFLPSFFETHSLPTMGLYDRKKQLIEVVDVSMPVQQLLEKFKR